MVQWLHFIPGEYVVLFIVVSEEAVRMWTTPRARLLDGLRAASCVLGFSAVDREEERLEELLPWAGAV